MGGGLMQLVAYGAQDIYLTGNPQITFFKVVYRRHTNFSMESIEQSASGVAKVTDSENEASFTISRNGDLIYKVYLTADASSHKITQGSRIIKEVEISIGGQMIDRHTQEWHDIWNELTITSSKSKGFKAMTGDIGKGGHSDSSLINSSMKSVKYIQIPLLFWFCRNPGLALPLIALQYHEVKIDFTFEKLSVIGKQHGAGYTDLNLKLFVDYIYLDTDERRRFAQVSHEYLIEQLQILETNNKIVNNLNFNHPVKEIIWTSQGESGNTNYGSAQIKLNGHDRFSKQEEEYFQLRQPFDYHTSIPHQNLPLSAKYSEMTSSFTDKFFSDSSSNDITALNYQSATVNISNLDDTNFVYGVLKLGSDTSTIYNASNKIPTLLHNNINANVLGTSDGVLNPDGSLLPIAQGEFFVMVFKSTTSVPHKLKDIFKESENFDIFAMGNKWIGGEYQEDRTLAYPATFRVLTTKDVAATTEIGATALADHFTFSGNAATDILHFVVFGSIFFEGTGDAYMNSRNDFQYFSDYRIKEINEEVIDQTSHFEASTSHMTKKINVYSFSLKPEEHQPSGTCNFSRIDTAQLITDNKIDSGHNIYAVNYNVLRIMSGMGGLAYSN